MLSIFKVPMITNNLFPTPVSSFNFDSVLTQDELDFINNQEVKPNAGNTTSKDTYLFKHPELARIKHFCEESLKEYFSEIYAPKNDVSLYITQSWSNYSSKGQWHHNHAHQNSIISGVFYVQAQPDIDKIYFYLDAYKQIKVPAENFNIYNSESWWLEAVTGRLYLFPSHLVHGVNTVESDVTRISISFNTFVKGGIGSDIELNGLNL